MNANKTFKLIAALLVIASFVLSACGNAPASSADPNVIAMWMTQTAAAGTIQPYQTIQTAAQATFNAQTGTPAPTLTPFKPETSTPQIWTATQPASTSTIAPTLTAAPSSDATVSAVTSCGAVMVGEPYVSKYLNNADDGDPSAFKLWLAGQGFNNTSNWQLNLLPPGASLDLESAEIIGHGWKVTGTIEQADCAVKAILKIMAVDAYLYSPATAQLGNEWHNTIAPFWKGKPFQYTEAKIETGGQWSPDMPLTYGDQKLCAPAGGYANGQMYDPKMPWTDKNTPRPAYHPAIQGSYCYNMTNVQGTWWSLTGDFNYNKVVDRWNQTHREVDLRDDHPKIYAIWCGDPNQVPVGFSTEMPAGSSCTKP